MNFSRGYSYLRFAKDINLNDNNNLLNIYNNSNESLNVLMSGIINKIDVKHAGIKQETIINTKQKILTPELNIFESENKNMNNNFLNMNRFPSKKNKRLSVIYSNALRKQSTIKNPLKKVQTIKSPLKKVSTIKSPLKKVSTIKNPLKKVSTIKNPLKKVSTIKNPLKKVSTIKNTLRKQSTIKKMLKNSIKINGNERRNNYLSQSSIKNKKSKLSNTHLSTNISTQKNFSNKNMRLNNDFIHRIYSVKNDPTVKIRKKIARKSVKFSEKFIRNNINKKKLTNNYTKDLFRDYSLKPKKFLNKEFSSIFEKIPENLMKKRRCNSVKQVLQKIYDLKYLSQNELFNKKTRYKTDILGSKLENEEYFKNNLFKKTLFEVSEIQNDIRSQLYGDSSDNDSRNKSKRSSRAGCFSGRTSINSTRIIINPEYFRVLKRKNLVYDSLVDEGENEDSKALVKGKYYILPDSIFKYILDFLLFLCIIYDNFFHSYDFAVNNKQVFEISKTEFVLNLILQIIYIIDFISGFFYAYFKDEVLITNIYLLIANFYETYLISDFLQAIPFEAIFTLKFRNKSLYYISYNIPSNNYMFFSFIRKFKFIKYISEDYNNTLLNLLRRFEHFYFYESVYKSIFVFFILLHNTTCYYILLGKSNYPNWIATLNLGNDEFGKIYTCALYYIISTLTTVGYGDISTYTCGERIFGMFILIFGIIGYSYSLTNVSNYVEKMKSKSEEYAEKKKFLDELQSGNKLNFDVYQKILKHIKYQETHKLDKNIILDSLPLGLRNTLLLEIYKPIIQRFTFFKNISNQFFIVQILLSFKPILAIKNDILIKDGDLVEEVFFVKNGKLSLEVPIKANDDDIEDVYNLFQDINAIHGIQKKSDNNLIDKIKKDDENNYNYISILVIRECEHYGIIERYLNQRSYVRVKVKTKKAELLFLDKNDIDNLAESYPQIWKKINKKSLVNSQRMKKLIIKSIKLHYLSNGIKINSLNESELNNLAEEEEVEEEEDIEYTEEEEEDDDDDDEGDYKSNYSHLKESLASNVIEENAEEEEFSDDTKEQLKKDPTKSGQMLNKLKSRQSFASKNTGQGFLDLLTKRRTSFNQLQIKKFIKNFDKENNISSATFSRKKKKKNTISQSLVNKNKTNYFKANLTHKNDTMNLVSGDLYQIKFTKLEKKNSESLDSHFEEDNENEEIKNTIASEKHDSSNKLKANLDIKRASTIKTNRASNKTLKYFSESESDKEKENSLTPFRKNEINNEIYPNEPNIVPIDLKKNNIDKIKNNHKKNANKNKYSFEIIKNDNFIIPNSYENINSICNNKYIKDFKTQNEIKQILEKKYQFNNNNLNIKHMKRSIEMKKFDKNKSFDFGQINKKSNNNIFNITILKGNLNENKDNNNTVLTNKNFNNKNFIEKKTNDFNYDLISNISNNNRSAMNNFSSINNDSFIKNTYNDNKNSSLLNIFNIS